MRITIGILLFCIAFAALAIAGCTQSTQTTPATMQQTAPATMPPATMPGTDTVKVSNTSLGQVLTDSKGLTLYYFITDVPKTGTSTCYAAANCSHFWPIFYTDNVVVSPPLDAGDFSSFTRTDGTMQTTYYGRPLYYFLKDTKPGDVNGENVLKTWFAAKPEPTVMIESTPELGAFLTDAYGRTLYVFVKDATGTSTCTGACIAKWPPFSTSTIVGPSVLKTSDFTQIIRADGINQTAYMGKPLYYYSGDTGQGMTTGSGFAGNWFVANITGILPAGTTPPTTVPTTLPTMIPYSGGGY